MTTPMPIQKTINKYVNKTDFCQVPRIDDRKSVVDDYSHVIEAWLKEDQKQPKK